MNEAVSLETEGRLATLVLNRPPRNVPDLSALRTLDSALAGLEAREDLQVLVLRAPEGSSFSYGVAVEDHVPERLGAMLTTFHGALRRLLAIPAVSIALVDGYCLGGGLELACCCDLVIAAEDSVVGFPEVELGCFPPAAATLLPRILGYPRTLELLTTGRRLSGSEARTYGLVWEAVPAADLGRRGEHFAGDILAKSAPVTRLIKETLSRRRSERILADLAETERIYRERLTGVHDMEEGIAAFLDKRAAVWSHR